MKSNAPEILIAVELLGLNWRNLIVGKQTDRLQLRDFQPYSSHCTRKNIDGGPKLIISQS